MKTSSVRINFLGDIGLFKKYEQLGINPFAEIVLPTADINVGNFEFPVSLEHNKQFYDVQDNYSCSPDYVKSLIFGNFRAFGLANNHILDYGLEGALQTIKLLKEKGCEVFGFSMDNGFSIGELEINEVKIAIVSCVKHGRWSKQNFGYGPDSYNISSICHILEKYKKKFHHIVVFVHWGTELIEVPNVEDVKNARLFIDNGASAVIGHHPHVSQGIEYYKGRIIAYSLGSFIYINEEELGYSSSDTSRNISICLSLEFSQNDVINSVAHYYHYNTQKKLPVMLAQPDAYAHYLNSNINNHKLFSKQLMRILIKREIRSFFLRFRKKPLLTISNYGTVLYRKFLKSN